MQSELHEMVSTTNRQFKYLEGTTAGLELDTQLNIYWFNNFHTSSIKEVKKTKNTITITTLNSVYKFKRINK